MSWWKKVWKMIKEWFDKEDPDPNPDPDPDPNDPPANDKDDLDPSKISWLGSNYGGAKIEAKINSAQIDNKFVYTNYDSYAGLNWPKKQVGSAKCDAICCLFYEKEDKIVGGKFDWWRVGGQGTKTNENVHHGYQGHTMPSKSDKVWTCFVSVDESKRSNIKEATWK